MDRTAKIMPSHAVSSSLPSEDSALAAPEADPEPETELRLARILLKNRNPNVEAPPDCHTIFAKAASLCSKKKSAKTALFAPSKTQRAVPSSIYTLTRIGVCEMTSRSKDRKSVV